MARANFLPQTCPPLDSDAAVYDAINALYLYINAQPKIVAWGTFTVSGGAIVFTSSYGIDTTACSIVAVGYYKFAFMVEQVGAVVPYTVVGSGENGALVRDVIVGPDSLQSKFFHLIASDDTGAPIELRTGCFVVVGR